MAVIKINNALLVIFEERFYSILAVSAVVTGEAVDIQCHVYVDEYCSSCGVHVFFCRHLSESAAAIAASV